MQGYSNRRIFMNDEKITKREVSSTKMLQSIIAHFGPRAPFVENTIYNLMDMLSEDYQGGSWKYFELSNGGFYMSPTSRESYNISWNDNYYEGTMSADAAGITACLFAYSHMSFRANFEQLSEYYQKLYEFMAAHEESEEIFAAID